MTDADATRDLIAGYYAAFNAGNLAGMLAAVAADVEHHVNEGDIRRGADRFAEFCGQMARRYREELRDIEIFVNPAGARAAAEFTVHGTYLESDPGLPAARGQRYALPAGAFFDVAGGRITRITTYYNLSDWIAQVSA
jgi:steroid delta-isomerase-like uncharacterized protein